MNILELLGANEKIYNKLCDDESKEIFRARLQYSVNRDRDEFCDFAADKKTTWRCKEVKEAMEEDETRKIVIYGTGEYGEHNYKILQMSKIEVYAFCEEEGSSINKKKFGKPILSHSELIEDCKDALIILSVRGNWGEKYQKLLQLGVGRKNILYPMHNRLFAVCGWQYFDFFKAKEGEVFLDAGSCTGSTSFDFIRWCNGDYDKIYAFEPDKENSYLCKKNFLQSGKDGIEVYPFGTWSHKTNLGFVGGNIGSSKIDKNAKNTIETVDIDSILQENKVTYIKMDVEGAELESLKGAEMTIRKNKPRMAISVYHKPWDILEIPLLILKINPDYKFALRHYTSKMWETVLYVY